MQRRPEDMGGVRLSEWLDTYEFMRGMYGPQA